MDAPWTERRSAARRAVDAPGVLRLDGGRERTCRVVDVSENGARLAIEPGTLLPERFALGLGIRRARPVRVVWRRGAELGVAFEA